MFLKSEALLPLLLSPVASVNRVSIDTENEKKSRKPLTCF